MHIEGPGLFHDGRRGPPVPVRFTLGLGSLDIRTPDGAPVAAWPVARLRRGRAGQGLAISAAGEAGRLEVTDAAAIGALAAALRAAPGERRDGWGASARVAGWLAAVLIGIAAAIWYGVPLLADQIAPLIPVSVEERLGEAVKPQVVASLTPGRTPRFCRAEPGLAALDRLAAPLLVAARTDVAAAVEVLDVALPNAFALPGGHIVLTRGLIERLDAPDQLAGILAHELGHVARRDAMRGLIQAAGLSLVIGIAIGDVTGSTVAVALGRVLIDAGYSRDTEAAADRHAIGLMRRIGRDPAALAAALEAIARDAPAPDGFLSWFSTHPAPAERMRRLRDEGGGPTAAVPLLAVAEWAALKAICR